jgi:hypothetical protein
MAEMDRHRPLRRAQRRKPGKEGAHLRRLRRHRGFRGFGRSGGVAAEGEDEGARAPGCAVLPAKLRVDRCKRFFPLAADLAYERASRRRTSSFSLAPQGRL